MRVVIPARGFRHVLRWAQHGLLSAGLVTLAYCGYVQGDSWMFQRVANGKLELLRSLPHPAVPPPSARLAPDSLIGRIDIPRIGVSVMILEGTGESTLRHAAGHVTGTGIAGQPGNMGIAAHRDTFFRRLRNIHASDVITVTTAQGEYHYRVLFTKVVDPAEVAVLDPDGGEVLTLVTCYPFTFVGSAPDRFIVRAERIADRLL